jgi:uncharacterized membrane protein YhhN
MIRLNTVSLYLILFWLTAIIHILSIIIELEIIKTISKPLLMIFLAGYFWSYARNLRQVKLSLMVYGALLFSFFGDILLMITEQTDIWPTLQEETWFILGLFSFLIAQIFYIISYRYYQSPERQKRGKYITISLSLVIILYTMILWAKLYSYLDGMLIPVTIYTLSILTMVLMAITRHNKTSAQSFILVFSGAVIFLLSDSMIAINKFITPLDYERLLIMITYILGQFLIISGLIEHMKLKITEPDI